MVARDLVPTDRTQVLKAVLVVTCSPLYAGGRRCNTLHNNKPVAGFVFSVNGIKRAEEGKYPELVMISSDLK